MSVSWNKTSHSFSVKEIEQDDNSFWGISKWDANVKAF